MRWNALSANIVSIICVVSAARRFSPGRGWAQRRRDAILRHLSRYVRVPSEYRRGNLGWRPIESSRLRRWPTLQDFEFDVLFAPYDVYTSPAANSASTVPRRMDKAGAWRVWDGGTPSCGDTRHSNAGRGSPAKTVCDRIALMLDALGWLFQAIVAHWALGFAGAAVLGPQEVLAVSSGPVLYGAIRLGGHVAVDA